MTETKRTFTNELGNEITITAVAVRAVQVCIIGPTSTSTNLLTWREAQFLRGCLSALMDQEVWETSQTKSSEHPASGPR
jgi:hypothetical protein